MSNETVSKGFDFAGQAIVITGGALGIGAAFCKQLAKRGARVGVADIRFEEAKSLADEIGDDATAFFVDTSSRDSFEELAEKSWEAFGQVNGIFNNAGVGGGGSIMPKIEQDYYDWIMAVNLKGVWNGCQVFGNRFLEQDGKALIVNTGSEHSFGVPHLGSAAYTAAKHAVMGMSDVLRREMPDRIQISLFCPGLTATDIWKSVEVKHPEFGGSGTVNHAQKFVMDQGMDPMDVADRALDAIASGAFYAVTHPHNLKMINERHAEQINAFETQCGDIKDGDKYEVNAVIKRLRTEAKSK